MCPTPLTSAGPSALPMVRSHSQQVNHPPTVLPLGYRPLSPPRRADTAEATPSLPSGPPECPPPVASTLPSGAPPALHAFPALACLLSTDRVQVGTCSSFQMLSSPFLPVLCCQSLSPALALPPPPDPRVLRMFDKDSRPNKCESAPESN